MREYLPITTKIIILTFFVNWCEITSVHSAELLKFWERDPEFEPRRSARHEDHKVRNTAEKQFRYNRGKDRGTTEPVQRGGHVAYRSRDDSEKRDTVQRGTGSDHGKHLRQGRISKTWPKVQHYFRNKNDLIRSTRFTQMYLMQNTPAKPPPKKGDFPEKLTPYFIAKQLEKLMEKFTDANVTLEIIGRTVEYNDIVLLKISESKRKGTRYFRAEDSKYIDEVPEKKIVFIVHALSPMGMHQLPCLTNDREFQLLVSYYLEYLDKFDIFLVPLANPDGYAEHLNNWNKNLSPQSACPGVALDRNFDVAWNVSRVISSCSQLYPGPTPFSEAETRAIRDVFHRYSHKIVAYFHVHAGSYKKSTFKGDAILYPKGYTDAQSDDDKYLDLRGEVDEAMKNASFQVLTVTVDTLYNWYGKISGSSVDYASTVYGIPYALELVMQVYENYGSPDGTDIKDDALTEIWKRMIDVLFNNIWKNTHNNDVK